jgi:acyl-CoA dehydrogenase
LLPVPGGPARRILQRTTRRCSAFALTADLSMLVLGGNLKRKEKLSGRLADILANLYLISAMVKQFEERGRPEDELPLLEWSCAESLRAIDSAFVGFFRNFPNRPIAWLLRFLTFPLGIRPQGASDRLGHKVAGLLMAPSALRDRLTHGIYLPTGTEEVLGRIDDALDKVIAAEAVEKKLRAARKAKQIFAVDETEALREGVAAGVISFAEAEMVEAANAARREVIRVDDFPPDYGQNGGRHGE